MTDTGVNEATAPTPAPRAQEGVRTRLGDVAVWVRTRALGIVLVVSVAALVIYRLGASLVGARVFLGLDLLYRFEPWESSRTAGPSNSSIYVSDHLDYFIPGIHEAVTRLWHGDIAGWSSSVGGGSPLLTTPNFGLLSPGRWIYFVMPTSLAPGWAKLLEMAFAALFTYCLVRRLSGSKLAACIAGFVYPMTGFMIAWTNWPQVAVGSVIPAVFWAIERYVQEQRLRTAIPVALTCALLIFGGFPAVAGQTLYFAGGYALVRVASTYGRDVRALGRHVLTLSGALALGFGVTAFQLLPFSSQFLEQVDLSYRDRSFFFASPTHYLLSATFPESFGGNQLWVGASPMDINTYVGSTVVLLAALGTMAALTGRLRRSAGLYFVFMVVAVLGLAYFQGSWSAWMDHLPVFHGNPIGRIRSQLGLPVAVLAAAGFDSLYRGALDTGWPRRLRPGWNWTTVAVATAVTVLIAAAGWLMTSGRVLGISNRVHQDVLVAVVPVGVATLLMLIGMRSSRARSAALFVLVVSVVVEAFAATSFYWPTGSRSSFYPSDEAIAFLQQHVGDDRMATLGYTLRPNATEYYGLRTLNGHAFLPERMRDLLKATDPSAFQGGPTYTILNPAVSAVIDSPGLDRLGVKYLVGSIDSVEPGTVSMPAPLPGAVDTLPRIVGSLPLESGSWYSEKVLGGPIRGVDIPLVISRQTAVTVAVRDRAGRLLAQTTRHVAAGQWIVPVPLAAEISGSISSSPVTVSVMTDADGVQARLAAGGTVALQAVRPPARDNRARLVFAGNGMVIYQRFGYLPRIHWAGQATVIRSATQRIDAVAHAPAARDIVILSAPPAIPLSGSVGTANRLRVLADSGDMVRVSADVSQPGYVVVSDNIQTDFVATVDGRRVDIVDADYAGGAVFVPKGKHDLVIRYAPDSARQGAEISAGSVVVLIILGLPPVFLAGLRRRLRRPKARTST